MMKFKRTKLFLHIHFMISGLTGIIDGLAPVISLGFYHTNLQMAYLVKYTILMSKK